MDIETQKVTAHLPKALLAEAQQATGAGITETLRTALEQLAEAKKREFHYRELLAMQGKGGISLTMEEIKEMREDRDLDRFRSDS